MKSRISKSEEALNVEIKKFKEIDLPIEINEVKLANGICFLNKKNPIYCIQRKLQSLDKDTVDKINKIVDVFIDDRYKM